MPARRNALPLATALMVALGCSGSSPGGGTPVADVSPDGGGTPVDGTGGADAGPGSGGTVSPSDGVTGAAGGVTGTADGGTAGGPSRPAQCAGLAPPADVGMKEFVLRPSGPPVDCRAGVGDSSGTMAFSTVMVYASAHRSTIDFVSTAGQSLGNYDTGDGVGVLQQPRGVAATSSPRYGPPTVGLPRWSPAGAALASGTWWQSGGYAAAADPAGGVLLAGRLTTTYSPTPGSTVAVMVTGGGEPYAVRWGPKPLASAGEVLGAGVDVQGRALVMTDGAARFGAGAVSGQWFERDGKALTDEFLLFRGFDRLHGATLEAAPLVGGGVLVRRLDDSFRPARAEALVTVASGGDTAEAAPAWMASRSGARLPLLRSGNGYAVLPYGAKGGPCTESVEVVAPDGTSCGSTEYRMADGTCDTAGMTLAQDGTLIQQLPLAMETITDSSGAPPGHSCTWRYWPEALR
jgi:hypothetical protein